MYLFDTSWQLASSCVLGGGGGALCHARPEGLSGCTRVSHALGWWWWWGLTTRIYRTPIPTPPFHPVLYSMLHPRILECSLRYWIMHGRLDLLHVKCPVELKPQQCGITLSGFRVKVRHNGDILVKGLKSGIGGILVKGLKSGIGDTSWLNGSSQA